MPVHGLQMCEQFQSMHGHWAVGTGSPFSSFPFLPPSQVRFLEQQNQVLETKWSLLQGQRTTRSNMTGMFEAYITNLRRQLEGLGQDKLRLESELGNVQGLVEEFRSK